MRSAFLTLVPGFFSNDTEESVRSAIVKPEILREHTAHLRHAQVDLMHGAGHAPFWENSHEFNRRLALFAKDCQ
jgi:pimeloyl-ACP methyl ester carboxylesterase